MIQSLTNYLVIYKLYSVAATMMANYHSSNNYFRGLYKYNWKFQRLPSGKELQLIQEQEAYNIGVKGDSKLHI